MPADSTASTAGMAARANRHSFYHLPDEEGGVGVTQKQIKLDAVLRPKHDRGLTVTNIRGSRGASGLVGGGTGLGNGEEGDEVPLHGIMVSKDFRQDG